MLADKMGDASPRLVIGSGQVGVQYSGRLSGLQPNISHHRVKVDIDASFVVYFQEPQDVDTVVEQPRSTQRHEPLVKDDEQALTNDIVGLATRFGRYGYRRITALLRHAGWDVNHKRVERIWRREGLNVPVRQPRRGRLRMNDGSCIRLRPERRIPVWAYDFVQVRSR